MTSACIKSQQQVFQPSQCHVSMALTGGNDSNTSTGSNPPGPSLFWRSSCKKENYYSHCTRNHDKWSIYICYRCFSFFHQQFLNTSISGLLHSKCAQTDNDRFYYKEHLHCGVIRHITQQPKPTSSYTTSNSTGYYSSASQRAHDWYVISTWYSLYPNSCAQW